MRLIAVVILIISTIACKKSNEKIFVDSDKMDVVSPREYFTNKNTCETCLDSLYKDYAYNVRSKLAPNDSLRNNLTGLFQNVNRLYSLLNYGGTFFAHQETRLIAEVEYSIYRIDNQEVSEHDFVIDKKKFLEALVDRVQDIESKNVYNQIDTLDSRERIKEIEQKIDFFQKKIKSKSVLKEVVRFENLYYNAKISVE